MVINEVHSGMKWLLSLLALVLASPAFAITYQAGLENSEWRMQSSELECRLWQPIPNFGEGVFSHRAGQDLQFQLRGTSGILMPGEAQLNVEGPSWKPMVRIEKMTNLLIVDDVVPLTVKVPFADLMMAKLVEGLTLTISAPGEPAMGYPAVKVAISTVNFAGAYADYERCVRNLIPVSFQQIERSSIFYASGRTKLAPAVLEQLDLIIRYVKADSQISRLVLDGHTDDTGDKTLNINVSKQRANLVFDYFKQAGISSKRLVLRWHGDRYPIASNDTNEGRALNRRVTIRLDRD